MESHMVGLPRHLCENCVSALPDSIYKVFSCDQPECRSILSEGPQVVDFLDEPCRKQLVEVLEMMDELEIPYVLNPTLVSGPLAREVLFRIGVTEEGGEFRTIWQGGDYSEALSALDEESAPAIGSTAYLEDLLEHVAQEELDFPDRADVFVISLGDHGAKKAIKLYHELGRAGIRVAESMLANSGIKDQLKEAKRFNPSLALIIGQKEALDDTVILRDMLSSMQEVFTTERILEEVRKRLGG
jgi:histidyl-tRNA synthetase